MNCLASERASLCVVKGRSDKSSLSFCEHYENEIAKIALRSAPQATWSSFFFSHESDLRLAVGRKTKMLALYALSTALLRNSPANKNAPFHNARISHVRATPPSKHAFSMRDGNCRRRTRSLNHRARSNRPVRAETRPTSGGHSLNGGCEFMTAIRTVLRAKRATETSKRAFSMRDGAFGRRTRSRNRRARSNRRARAESRKTSGR